MASAWFYQIDGTERGPVSSAELADLARGGKLKPTDPLRKEGTGEWQLAGRVKGLFPSAAAPAPAPPATPAEPPNVASAAKGLFDAVASAAKRVGEKVTEGAKQSPSKPAAGPEAQDASPSDSSLEPPVVPKVSRRTMIAASVGCGVLLLSCLTCGLIGVFVDTGGGEVQAKLTAESFVEKRLKAPSTAEFPSRSDFKATEVEKNVWRVSSYVDAQNAFGAKIRTYWVVTQRYEGKANWTLISCDFSN